MNGMTTLPRIGFARRAVVAGMLAIAWVAAWPRRLRARETAPEENDAGTSRKPRWGMAIDLDRCTGCGACVIACRVENNVAVAGPSEERRGTAVFWMDLLPRDTPGIDSERPPDVLPLPCMHCDNAPCVKVCPVGATYHTAEGIVAQIYDRCIGCRFCQVACPYGRRSFNWSDPEWTETHVQYLNPDVSVRPRGTVEKCNFCHHRIRALQEMARIEDRELTDDDVSRLPACAQACPAEAIVFGDLDADGNRVAHLAASPRAFRLLEHLGTKPRVWYLARDRE